MQGHDSKTTLDALYSKEGQEFVKEVVNTTLHKQGIGNGGISLHDHNCAMQWAVKQYKKSDQDHRTLRNAIVTVIGTVLGTSLLHQVYSAISNAQ